MVKENTRKMLEMMSRVENGEGKHKEDVGNDE